MDRREQLDKYYNSLSKEKLLFLRDSYIEGSYYYNYFDKILISKQINETNNYLISINKSLDELLKLIKELE